MTKQHYYLAILFSLLLNNMLLGQCKDIQLSKVIRIANEYYSEGRLEEAINTLVPALSDSKKNCTTVTREARVLLTKLYLMEGDKEKAKAIYSKLTLQEPFYELEPLEPIELQSFAERYRAIPHWSFGVELSSINVLNDTVPTNNNFIVNDYRTMPTAYEGGNTLGGLISISYHFNRRWELSLGVGYDQLLLERRHPSFFISERQRRFTFPAQFKANFWFKNLNIYVFGGGEFSQLNNISFLEVQDLQETVIGLNIADIKDEILAYNSFSTSSSLNSNIEETRILLREQYYTAIQGGIGFRFSPLAFKGNYIVFNTTYSAIFNHYGQSSNFTELADTEQENLRKILVYSMGFIDQPVYLDYLRFSLGFQMTLYKIKNL